MTATSSYCPNCREELSADIDVCPACGTNIRAFWDGADYVDKLINALGHPEPTTPIRAASILGQLHDDKAVKPLISLIEKTQDIYIARAAVEALGHFPTKRVLKFLQDVASRHPALMVKETAETQLSNMICSLHGSTSAPAMGSPALYPQVAPQRVARWSYARLALRRNGCSIARERNAADGRRAARPKGTLAHGPYPRCGACQWNNHWLRTAPWSDPCARVLWRDLRVKGRGSRTPSRNARRH